MAGALGPFSVVESARRGHLARRQTQCPPNERGAVPLSRLPISQSLSRQIRPPACHNSKWFSNLAYRVADGRHPVAAIIKQSEQLDPTLATDMIQIKGLATEINSIIRFSSLPE